jgi:hypothetical protein
MTNQPSSKNPFADPNIPTMDVVLEQIETDYQIPHQRRHDFCSAIRKLETLFGRPLSMMPASAEFLRRLFNGAHHLSAAMSERRLKNIRSLIMAAFRHVKISTSFAPYGAPLSNEWQLLMDSITSKYHRSAVSRFARYSSNCKISIMNVCDGVIEVYQEDLISETLVKKPHLNVQTLCRVWNKIAEDTPVLDMPRLAIPRKESRNYAVSEDQLSSALLKEIDAYLHFLSGDELIGGIRNPLRPRTIKAIKGNIIRYLSALHHAEVDISSIHNLEAMVDFDLFKIAIEWFWDRFEQKSCQGIGEIAWTIRCIAVKHLQCDEQTAEQFGNVVARVSPSRQGLSSKNLIAMQQFDDVDVARRFLRVGDNLWDLAEQEGLTKKGSLLAQSAVLLDILTFAPMRITNLQNLHIDRHISWSKGRFRISIPAAEVKNSENLDYLLPEHNSARIADYMKTWRPLFFPKSNPFLFPGRKGAKDVTALRRQITTTLFKHTAIQLTPHQFRHAAAKILLDQKPGHYEVVRKVLGHKNITTTYEHYAGAETQSALELYDSVILDIKNDRPKMVDNKRTNLAAQAFIDPLNPFGSEARR